MIAPTTPIDRVIGHHPDDDEPAAAPGTRARCAWCSLTVELAPVAELTDGTPIYGWRHIRHQRSPVCAASSKGRHTPKRSEMKAGDAT